MSLYLLLVDDRENEVDAWEGCLERVEAIMNMGIKFLKAYDGKSALELIDSHSNDICGVVTDLGVTSAIDGIDGIKIIEHARDRVSDLPGLLITSRSPPAGYIGVTGNFYVAKPVEIALLRQVAREMLSL